jgi:hypothetical protein
MGKMINVKCLVLILVAVLMVSGCASYPTVTYLPPSSKDADGAIKYYLQGSFVTLTAVGGQESREENGSGENKKKSVNTEFLKTSVNSVNELKEKNVRAIVTATESRKHFYAIKPHESAWSKTMVSVSYVDNTSLIKSIGTSFEDNRIKIIEASGAIITSLIPMFKAPLIAPVIPIPGISAEKKLNLPVVIDLSEMDDAQSIGWSRIPGHELWWYKIDLMDPPSDSRKSSEYFNEINGTKVRALAYSSCQDARLFVTYSESQPSTIVADVAMFNIRIANPNYVTTLNFPAKGSISMHSICGVDIKTEESKDVSNLDIVEALIKQVEAIKKAQKADDAN